MFRNDLLSAIHYLVSGAHFTLWYLFLRSIAPLYSALLFFRYSFGDIWYRALKIR